MTWALIMSWYSSKCLMGPYYLQLPHHLQLRTRHSASMSAYLLKALICLVTFHNLSRVKPVYSLSPKLAPGLPAPEIVTCAIPGTLSPSSSAYGSQSHLSPVPLPWERSWHSNALSPSRTSILLLCMNTVTVTLLLLLLVICWPFLSSFICFSFF
jgi:hypothetical protein